MMRTNFHTHTYRCGHAVGDEEAMVKSAIKNNIEVLGFSDHVPLPHYRFHILKGMSRAIFNLRAFLVACKAIITGGPAMRMPYSNRKAHQDIVANLKKQYQNDIVIYQGYEAEYFKEYLSYYQSLLDNKEVDYLILGNHFNKYSVHNCYYGDVSISDDMVRQYRDDVVEAIKSNLFSYVAHPDLFMIGKVYFDEVCKEVAYDICRTAKEYDIPLEINAGGMRRGRRKVGDEMLYPYPNDHFFKIASEIGNKVIFGIDGHSPDDFNDNAFYDLQHFAKQFNLNVVETFEFRKGK